MKNRKSTVGEEIALTLVTCSCVIGFTRLFIGYRYLPLLMLTALSAHFLAAITRRFAGLLASPIMVISGIVVTAYAGLTAATTYGVPTAQTGYAVGQALSEAWRGLATAKAPTEPTEAFVFASALILWVIAWLADRLSFKWAAPTEAVAPAATLFVFQTLLTGPQHRHLSTAVFAFSLLIYALAHRSSVGDSTQAGLHSDRSIRRATLGSGAIIAVVVVTLAMLVGQLVPGASGSGVVDVRGSRGGNTPRSVVSPLVDIKSRLISNLNRPMFTVTASQPAYWRLMALDQFDGSVWSSDQSFSAARGHLKPGPGEEIDTVTMRAAFAMDGLSGPWAPTAFRATSVTPSDQLSWDKATSTFIVTRKQGSVDGISYRVTAEYPDVSRAEVQNATGEIPASVKKRDLSVPAGFKEKHAKVLEQFTNPNWTPFEKALELQNFFRINGGFNYSLNVPPGQSVGDITSFLNRRTGYCEQFAGTYAALARALGLPSRVVVGFTQGNPGPTKDTYEVTGRNAHAWPEVYIGGVGWLSFEPTPGRGDPNAEQYTGIIPQQAAPNDPESAIATPTIAPAPSPNPIPPAPTPTAPASVPLPDATQPQVTQQATAPPVQNPWIRTGFVVGAAVALLVGLVLLSSRRNTRRKQSLRNGAHSPAARILVAWNEVLDAWAPVGLTRLSSNTHIDFGHRLAEHVDALPDSSATSNDARRLASLTTTAAWRADDIEAPDADEARRAADEFCKTAMDQLSPLRRFLVRIDPRKPRRES